MKKSDLFVVNLLFEVYGRGTKQKFLFIEAHDPYAGECTVGNHKEFCDKPHTWTRVSRELVLHIIQDNGAGTSWNFCA